MLSSFQQNWFYLFRTSIAIETAFPVCEKGFLSFPFWFYNILLDHDVSLHNLVVLFVTIPTSPRLSKTESICKRYGFCFNCWNYPGEGPESPAYRNLRPCDPESPAPCFRCRFVFAVVPLWTRSGDTPEMVRSLRHDRSLRPEDPESPAPGFLSCFASVWCRSGVGPEPPRRVPGVSG